MSSVFVASQSSCFFLCSREQIRLVENRLKGFHTPNKCWRCRKQKGRLQNPSIVKADSTQENKDRTGPFPSCIIHTARQKVKNTSTLYHSGCGSHVKLEQKMGTPTWAGSILFRSGPIPCLFSWVHEIDLFHCSRFTRAGGASMFQL